MFVHKLTAACIQSPGNPCCVLYLEASLRGLLLIGELLDMDVSSLQPQHPAVLGREDGVYVSLESFTIENVLRDAMQFSNTSLDLYQTLRS